MSVDQRRSAVENGSIVCVSGTGVREGCPYARRKTVDFRRKMPSLGVEPDPGFRTPGPAANGRIRNAINHHPDGHYAACSIWLHVRVSLPAASGSVLPVDRTELGAGGYPRLDCFVPTGPGQ